LNFNYQCVAVGTIPVAEILSGKMDFFSKHQRFLIATGFLGFFDIVVYAKRQEIG
jgi:hypothetical protein